MKASLPQEKVRIEFLNQVVNKCNRISKEMLSSLESFDRRLQSLQDVALPISNNTNRLQTTLKNIERTVMLFDNVLQFYTVYDDLHNYISAGPSGDITQYLRNLEQLQGSLDYFKTITVQQKITETEYDKVNGLLKWGQRKLMSECEVLIVKYSNTYQPTDLDILLSGDHDALYQPRYTMTESDRGTLSMVFKWFGQQHFKYGPVNLYASTRGDMIKKSLEMYRKRQMDYDSSIVEPAVVKLSASTSSSPQKHASRTPNHERRILGSIAYRRHKHRFPSLPRSSPSETSPINQSGQSSSSFREEENEILNQYKLVGTLIVLVFMLFEREKKQIDAIFTYDLADEVFAGVSQSSLLYLQGIAEDLCTEIPDVSKTSWALSLLHILNELLNLRPAFVRMFGATFDNRQSQVCQLSLIFEQTAVKALTDIIDEVKVDPKQDYFLSLGGGVQQITYTTLSFVETVYHRYFNVASLITDGLYDSSQLKSSIVFKVNEEGAVTRWGALDESLVPSEKNTNLSKYLVTLLKWLNTNLLAKSDCYESPDKTIRSIYLLNNVQYILHTLKRSHLITLLHLTRSDIDDQYTHDIDTYKKEYSNCYAKLANMLQSAIEWQSTQRIADTKLKEKDREAIKDAFNNINREIEFLIELHDSLIVHDIELRQALRSENKALLLPIYTKFYQTFTRKDFTKNPSKYMRYSVEMLSHRMDNFFEKCS